MGIESKKIAEGNQHKLRGMENFLWFPRGFLFSTPQGIYGPVASNALNKSFCLTMIIEIELMEIHALHEVAERLGLEGS